MAVFSAGLRCFNRSWITPPKLQSRRGDCKNILLSFLTNIV